MNTVLITGATGNIGSAVLKHLSKAKSELNIVAAVRDIGKAKETLCGLTNIKYRVFDLENSDTFPNAFKGVNTLFLLRPPHISNVELFFTPLLQKAHEQNIQNVVFLSVQGAEKSKVIPHNKIERLIRSYPFHHIFIRPSYFMQNLTTALLPELVKHQSITLPSGEAQFNWVDVDNIGEAGAHLIKNFEQHQDQAFEITGNENLNFYEVAQIITDVTNVEITYKSVNPVSFFIRKMKESKPFGLALVMTLLHFLPRLQKPPTVTNHYKTLTGKFPTTLRAFIKRELNTLVPSLNIAHK